MIQELFDKNIFMYIMLGLCLIGVLLKVVLEIEYARLIKASDNMGTSKNKLTQMMKKKFETCYKLKIGVNNVDIFVDKYVYRHRFCGVLLSTWENIGGQILMLCLLTGSISAVLGLIYECGKQDILTTFSAGILTSGLLIFLEGMINFTGKKELIRLNMKDYLENFFKVRLEQELYHPEMIEQFKKELLLQGEEDLTMNSALGDVVTSQANQKAEMKEAKREASKEKREAIKQQREDKRIEKQREKAKVAIEKEKIQDEKRRRRLVMLETREKIKKEARLAEEQKREQKSIELEQKLLEAKALEENKKREKLRQEEIKKALLIEKQILKEDKKHTVEHKTPAQEKKEILKKEILQRRSMETPEPDNLVEEAKAENDIVSVTELEDKVEIAMSSETDKPQLEDVKPQVETVKVQAETTNPQTETIKPQVEATKLQSEPIKSQGKLKNTKKQKQSDQGEEKLIEDILKEFLA